MGRLPTFPDRVLHHDAAINATDLALRAFEARPTRREALADLARAAREAGMNESAATLCLDALEDALRKGRPEIFNADRGAQFTSAAFTDKLEAAGVRINMDGRGRWLDTVFVERLWRSLKYEEVHLKAYANALEARSGIGQRFRFYNESRPHQALIYKIPGGGVGGRGVPCGFAAALGRRWRLAHNSMGPTIA